MAANLDLIAGLQLERLVAALGVPADTAHWLFETLARETLKQYDEHVGGFSGINGDGLPLQWSVSIGRRPSGLRFVTEGALHLPVTRRMRLSCRLIAHVADSLSESFRNQIDTALFPMLPTADALITTGSQMGIWFGSTLTPDGEISLKIYANQEVGNVAGAYYRLGDCLQAVGSLSGLDRLAHVATAVGDSAVPAFSAIDARPHGKPRIKLYFHGGTETGNLISRLARALDCAESVRQIELFLHIVTGRPGWPTHCGFVSLDLADDSECKLKVDLGIASIGASDKEADRRIRRALKELGLNDDEYHAARDALLGCPTKDARAAMIAISCTAGSHDVAVNAYFTPGV